MNFNPEKTVNEIIDFIKKYFTENNLKGVIIGISGGKDSAVSAALFTKALGKENVIGVTMPCHSNKQDRLDAMIIAEEYGFELINIDLTNTFDTFKENIKVSQDKLIEADINLKPRLRMSTLYYLAAMYKEINNGTYIVCGNSNKSENFVGYFTKGGDSVCDINVLSDLTVSEVIKIGEYLNVNKKILYKAPSDGLSNLSDEDKLGVTYDEIEKFINNEKLDENTYNKIDKMHKNSRHKFKIPSYKKCD